VVHLFEQYRAKIEQVVRRPGLRTNSVRVSAAPKDQAERRREERVELWQPCVFETSEARGERMVMTQSGKAVTLDQSREGMLLLMEEAPVPTKMLEIHSPLSLGRKTLQLFDVRWVKPVQVPSVGECYLVGCRRTFGPYPYMQF
jgi:hypothetical protein